MSMTNEEAKAWVRVFELAGIDVEGIAKTMLKIAEAIAWAFVIQAKELDRAMREVANAASRLPSMEELEKLEAELRVCSCDTLPSPNYWKLKELRMRRRDANRATNVHMRQYKTRKNALSTQKKSGPRGREWHGPWKEN